ncbi:ABC transporter ATP-binding protein [Arcanobacterium haemolyticum]|uniref:ABC transporter related protein n=1 Tax=Arcanobacterium haemolyticum (strain ATCC 9345 / DSM 20595 / CCM 5947 / CCUG 17215 / LMG 16163 / NBRC 15585 / NCTC 8452 / 11018) TaxID=644284 RepID=D7BKP2_ARCHD|nr:ATP-binding cassette domain-containing protein [Arcanobacterium haemolyticum]ADH93222.1 ABC transporter related protein [Arcanobacterium haemolyticum DSM 20595]SPT75863.1 Lipopolysaccharide export system ATP-binding protein LptB [Arcanobacterium haemolyticum]SQH28015.1 Lipopolysaccharide export system ATP-binding protein LptB [Arcanobacterium haemolyticum]
MILHISNLHKRFGSTVALAGMEFTVQPGELYGFVGSNGAGKTTTMRIILGVLSADSGTVTLNGKELDFDTRKTFGYMPAERGLYPKMQVNDQLIYLARLHGLTTDEATNAMMHWTERLGLAHRRNDEVQALSLGNQQRVQLAAALIHNPSVLVLDEPFSGLDPVAVDVMSDVLREKANAGATVVFSSHQLDLVERMCERVGICSEGKIVAEGTIDALRTTPENNISMRTGGDIDTLTATLLSQGITASRMGTDTLHVKVGAGIDPQTVLHTALAAGPVLEFAPHRPHLQEIFKDVVSTPVEETTEEPTPVRKSGFGALFGKKK